MSKQVIIIGAGFGGLRAARILAQNQHVSVTVIDRRNHHLFQPLLYQVATAGLSPAQIAVPIRSVLGGRKNVDVVLAEVERIDAAESKIHLKNNKLNFDYLIVAAGSDPSYFGHDEWSHTAPGLKSLEDATDIRRRILRAYEQAEVEPNAEIRTALLTFVIIGGGPTGVEMAGSIAEISRQTLAKDFNHIDPSSARVILIEAGPRLLASFSSTLSQRAKQDLESLGVHIWTNMRVTHMGPDHVDLAHERLSCRTIVWAAGVKPSPLGASLGTLLDPTGRVIVDAHLNVPGLKKIFVIGDMAHAPTSDGKGYPGLAPVAMQQGEYVARRILRHLKNGQDTGPFRYRDKGMMATIGRKRAVVEYGKLKVTGPLAWLMWLFIHVFYLIGFKNKFVVMLEWFWSYVTFRRGARLILGPDLKRDP